MSSTPQYPTRRPAHFTTYQDKAGKFRWRLVSSNGNTICASTQGYKTMTDCVSNARRTGLFLQALPPQLPTTASGGHRVPVLPAEEPRNE